MQLPPSYLALKVLAYSAWMFVGMRAFRREGWSRIGTAMGLGILRVLVGLGFGLAIAVASEAVSDVVRSVSYTEWVSVTAAYLAIYVPVRWIEWGVFDLAPRGDSSWLRGVVMGHGRRTWWWRGGGIVVSCLADIPVILALGGIPMLGSFLC